MFRKNAVLSVFNVNAWKPECKPGTHDFRSMLATRVPRGACVGGQAATMLVFACSQCGAHPNKC